jgi:hypothetical protein
MARPAPAEAVQEVRLFKLEDEETNIIFFSSFVLKDQMVLFMAGDQYVDARVRVHVRVHGGYNYHHVDEDQTPHLNEPVERLGLQILPLKDFLQNVDAVLNHSYSSHAKINAQVPDQWHDWVR